MFAFPVITNYNDKIATKLNENATLDVDYYSNVAESDIKLYKNVFGFKEGKLLYSILQTDVQVDLHVFTHTIKTSGTKARILIPIKSKADLGVYDVVVSNKIGQVMRSVEIVPKGLPSSPTNVSVDEIQLNSVRISWTAGYNGGSPQTFVILTSRDMIIWKTDSVNGGLTESKGPRSYVLKRLFASTTYYVKMYAYNEEGNSQFTEIVNYTTSAEVANRESTTSSTLNTAGVVGVVVLAIIVVAAVVVVIIAWRKGITPGYNS